MLGDRFTRRRRGETIHGFDSKSDRYEGTIRAVTQRVRDFEVSRAVLAGQFPSKNNLIAPKAQRAGTCQGRRRLSKPLDWEMTATRCRDVRLVIGPSGVLSPKRVPIGEKGLSAVGIRLHRERTATTH